MNMHEILRKDPEIWDLFTRKEEYTNPQRDQYDRFPYFASKNRDIFEPLTSQYLNEHGYSVEYPNDAPFAVCLTHDVDVVYQSLFSKGFQAVKDIKSGKFRAVINNTRNFYSKRKPRWNFSDIITLEEKYGARSSFFFMALEPIDQGYTYPVSDLATEMGQIIDKGCEIGLHGGHTAYNNLNEIQKEKLALEGVLGKKVIGYRNHFLQFKVPDTWEYLSKAGFAYDTTLGYADCAGFRNGMCHPFRPFNLNTNKDIDILEIPLMLMDNTLGPTYMRLNSAISWDLTKSIIDTVERNQGVFTILWHNHTIADSHSKIYEKILKYCYDKKAWLTDGRSIFQWMVIQNGKL